MIRICFLIRQFNVGGAQRQVIELAKNLDKTKYDVSVVTFYGGGQLERDILSVEAVKLLCVGKRGRWDVLPFLFRLARMLRALKPDILHGYLGVSNILCTLLRPFVGRPRVIWGARASFKDLKHYDWLTRVTFWLECFFSRFPDLILANSEAGKRYYVSQGFPDWKTVVIPNGIDTVRFCPNGDGRQRVRAEWGISEEHFLIGIVARLDPRKDHETFFRAASILAGERNDVRFVCVGDGPKDYREHLHSLARSLGIEGRIVWAGARADMPAIYNALDLLTSSSAFGEGFSNSIGEAMAVSVPCVATNVGDAAQIVGDTGFLLGPGDPCELVSVWRKVLRLSGPQRAALGERARCRILREFGSEMLATRTDRYFASLL